MKYTIHNLSNGLYWDDTCELFRIGGLVPLYNTEDEAKNVIIKKELKECEVLPVLLIPNPDDND